MSFSDALKKYKKTATEVVPVNPPEAVAVMEEKTVPEVETPKATPAADVSTQAAGESESGVVGAEKKARSLRGFSKKSADSVALVDADVAYVLHNATLGTLTREIARRLPKGTTIVISAD